jgi:hypothetical protein
MIFAMILFSLAIVIAVWSITRSNTMNEGIWLIFLILSGFCVMGGIIIVDSTPTNKDVRKGKAHYVEQNHIEIVNGDTINTYKTYQIEWNQNTK